LADAIRYKTRWDAETGEIYKIPAVKGLHKVYFRKALITNEIQVPITYCKIRN
jgi:hypothetical protein